MHQASLHGLPPEPETVNPCLCSAVDTLLRAVAWVVGDPGSNPLPDYRDMNLPLSPAIMRLVSICSTEIVSPLKTKTKLNMNEAEV